MMCAAWCDSSLARGLCSCCIRVTARGSVLAQAPVKPKSAVGEMLAYYYQAQPHLFKEVIERQFGVLAEERDAKEAAEREQKESAAAEEEGRPAPWTSRCTGAHRNAQHCTISSCTRRVSQRHSHVFNNTWWHK